eukprot:m.125503 g.125503  ORF g.125503 m.125503 type:complete len:529 (+) comp19784_c0_seq3:67-1653(+)
MAGAVRLRRGSVIVFLVLALACAAGTLWLWRSRQPLPDVQHTHAPDADGVEPAMAQQITLLFRDFEEFENRLVEAAQAWSQALPGVQILIVGDRVPYPPLQLPVALRDTVRISSASFDVRHSEAQTVQDLHISTPYTLVLPDNTFPAEASSAERLRATLVFLNSQDEAGVVGAFLPSSSAAATECSHVEFAVRNWTVTLQQHPAAGPVPLLAAAGRKWRGCDAVDSPHAVLLLRTPSLVATQWTQFRPLVWGLALRLNVLQGHKLVAPVSADGAAEQPWVKLHPGLFSTPHNAEKSQRLLRERLKAMYQRFGIKLVRRATTKGGDEWWGCSRNTARCFGTIVDDRPEYLQAGRWTPPCCMRNLHETIRYVVHTLEACSARYWLEGGSLLGAARHGSVIPWDYDADLGIHMDDVDHCPPLAAAKRNGQHEDQGFVWEKAREGEFYRVQFSRFNHMHVDIFPFYEKDGTMTKDTWFASHRQDMPFPAAFISPLEKINFVGIPVSVPNKHVAFLELKFGAGVVDHPKYPGD